MVAIILIIFILVFTISYLKIIHDSLKCVKIQNGSINVHVTSAKETEKVYKQAPGPFPLPVLGNLHLLGKYKVPFKAFTDISKTYGDIYTLTLGTTRCIVVNNLTLIREVLNQNGKFVGGRPNFIRYGRLFGGDRNNSLALCDWSQLQQKRRNLARRHCSPRSCSSFYEKINDIGTIEISEFLNKLTKEEVSGKEFHLKPLVMQTCANMFCHYMCTTRFDYNDEEFQHIVYLFDEIFWEVNQGYAVDFLPWLLPFYTGHMKKIERWTEKIRQFIIERIIAKREESIDLTMPEKDFTDALLRNLSENGSREILMFMLEDFLGGHSAVGNLVILTLAYIVRFPECIVKIQEEIDRVIYDQKLLHRFTHNSNEKMYKITLNDIERMPFTVATIYEVLRYCSSPIVPHVATEDIVVGGYGVTKGTMIIINNYELNTSDKYWANPEKFDPERFLENYTVTGSSQDQSFKTNIVQSSVDDKNGNKQMNSILVRKRIKKNIPHFLPFSIGKRTCIGQNLVKGFGFVMIANILKDYNVSCKDLLSIKTYDACVALPPQTFPLTLTKRF